MAQAGVAQYHTASTQPMRTRTPQRANGNRRVNGNPKPAQPGSMRSGARTGSSSRRFSGAGGKLNTQRTPSGQSGQTMYPGKVPGSTAGRPSAEKRLVGISGQTIAAGSGRRPVKSPVRTSPGAKKPIVSAAVQRAEMEYRRWQREQIRHREKINRTMVWLSGCLIVIALFGYIGRMAEISAFSKQIDQLQTENTELKEQKRYKEVELAASQNVERVEDEALGRLGMIAPSAEQIRHISLSEYLK